MSSTSGVHKQRPKSLSQKKIKTGILLEMETKHNSTVHVSQKRQLVTQIANRAECQTCGE